MSKLDRRSFLKTAGVATGVAVVGGVPAAAAAATEGRTELVASPAALPREPLVAFVRDAGKAEVTIVSGLNELTVRDPLLVKRLQKVAAHPKARLGKGGVI
jgi:TAT (twin-arginine translocation) pathway-exported protein